MKSDILIYERKRYEIIPPNKTGRALARQENCQKKSFATSLKILIV